MGKKSRLLEEWEKGTNTVRQAAKENGIKFV